MKILVTGGAGYIGSHVVFELCDKGHDVVIIDNMSSGCEENIDSRCEIIYGNINNNSDLNRAFKNSIDIVFHFAASKAPGESMLNPALYSKNNISGTLNLLGKMLEYEVRSIVFSSTAALYGIPEYLPIDEKHPTNPINYYGYTKLVIEQNLNWYSKLKGINYAALRYFNATGYDINGRIKGREVNPQNLFPVVMENLAGKRESISVFGNDYNTQDGTCIRDYIHVNDLATAHLRAMEYLLSEKKNLVVNLGTGRGYSVLEVINAAMEISGLDVKYKFAERREGDAENVIASSSLANNLLGWTAKYSSLETIIKTMLPLYLK